MSTAIIVVDFKGCELHRLVPATWLRPAWPRQSWTLLNRFRTDQGPCRANLHKWSLAASEFCDCGERQTMGHIVDSCPLTQLDGGLTVLTSLHKADDAVTWL